jgi:hypothetical protein
MQLPFDRARAGFSDIATLTDLEAPRRGRLTPRDAAPALALLPADVADYPAFTGISLEAAARFGM